MKHKLKLCKECEITSECVTHCKDSIDFEKLDTRSNYNHTKYQPKGVTLNWSDMKFNGGISRFK
jgi:hypothetical protein